MFLFNPSYSIPILICNSSFTGNSSGECSINLTNDLAIYQYSRSDWQIEIVVTDFNSSNWTSPNWVVWQSDNFSLYIIPEKIDPLPAIETVSGEKGGSILMISGVFGLILGLGLATSVALLRKKKNTNTIVEDPFIDNNS